MENLVGKKMYGFKYETTDNLIYASALDKYIFAIGTITGVSEANNFVKVSFDSEESWFYPLHLVSSFLVPESVTTFDENINNVIIWASSRGLLTPQNANKQMLKVMEEIGETASALAKGKQEELIDGIGDSFVTLIILSKQLGLDPAYCLDKAWNEIKDRQGKTVNGVFIKE